MAKFHRGTVTLVCDLDGESVVIEAPIMLVIDGTRQTFCQVTGSMPAINRNPLVVKSAVKVWSAKAKSKAGRALDRVTGQSEPPPTV